MAPAPTPEIFSEAVKDVRGQLGLSQKGLDR